MEATKLRVRARRPRLFQIRDPRKLADLGQLYLPGLELETPKTSDQAWSKLESANPGNIGRSAPKYTGPGLYTAG